MVDNASRPIAYKCPSCRAKLESVAELGGKEDKCPQCGATCLVPMTRQQRAEERQRREQERQEASHRQWEEQVKAVQEKYCAACGIPIHFGAYTSKGHVLCHGCRQQAERATAWAERATVRRELGLPDKPSDAPRSPLAVALALWFIFGILVILVVLLSQMVGLLSQMHVY